MNIRQTDSERPLLELELSVARRLVGLCKSTAVIHEPWVSFLFCDNVQGSVFETRRGGITSVGGE